MPRLFTRYFHPKEASQCCIYECKSCGFELTLEDAVVSKDFRGHSGAAFLVDQVRNVHFDAAEMRFLLTGRHQVRNVLCDGCGKVIGWKYEVAYEEHEKYKEGKYVLERAYLRKLEQD